MKTLLVLISIAIILFPFSFLFSDPEFSIILDSLKDLNNPDINDYQIIDEYLKKSPRRYLDSFEKSIAENGNIEVKEGCRKRLNLIRNFRLLGENGEMPIFEKHSFNIKNISKYRCILLFGSYNRNYPEKARKVLSELKDKGYSGHVLLQIGGFPNTANGGLKLSHVPYAFKVAFLEEARLMGYEEVLWVDTAIHPLTDLETIFLEIRKKGYFLRCVGRLKDNAFYHLPLAMEFLGLGPKQLDEIPHISSGIMGFNMKDKRILEFLHSWYQETEKVYSNITWFPEELALSALAWRYSIQVSSWLGDVLCGEQEVSRVADRPHLQFFLDGER